MADTKISALANDPSPASTDVIPIVKDPTGTPLNRSWTFATLSAALAAAGVASGGLTTPRIPFRGATALDDDPALIWDDTGKRLVVAATGQALDAPPGGQIHIGGDSAGAGLGGITLDGYGSLPSINMRSSLGTQAAKTANAGGNAAFQLRSYLYDGSAFFLGGLMRMLANGAQSGSNGGQDFAVYLTANGSTTTANSAGQQRFRVTAGATITKAVVNGCFGHDTALGAGGTVTQGAGSGKATAVTLDKPTGAITLNNAALAASTTVSFTLTNNQIEAHDLVLVTHKSAGTGGAYSVAAFPAAGSATVYVRNLTLGSLGEAIVLSFSVIKGSVN